MKPELRASLDRLRDRGDLFAEEVIRLTQQAHAAGEEIGSRDAVAQALIEAIAAAHRSVLVVLAMRDPMAMLKTATALKAFVRKTTRNARELRPDHRRKNATAMRFVLRARNTLRECAAAMLYPNTTKKGS